MHAEQPQIGDEVSAGGVARGAGGVLAAAAVHLDQPLAVGAAAQRGGLEADQLDALDAGRGGERRGLLPLPARRLLRAMTAVLVITGAGVALGAASDPTTRQMPIGLAVSGQGLLLRDRC